MELAADLLRQDPSAGDGCELDNSVAGWMLTRPVGPAGARQYAEAAVRLARREIGAEG